MIQEFFTLELLAIIIKIMIGLFLGWVVVKVYYYKTKHKAGKFESTIKLKSDKGYTEIEIKPESFDVLFDVSRTELESIAKYKESTQSLKAVQSIQYINYLIVKNFPNHFATYLIKNFGVIFTFDIVDNMVPNWLCYLPSTREDAHEIKVIIDTDNIDSDIDKLGRGLDLIIQELTKYSTQSYGRK